LCKVRFQSGVSIRVFIHFRAIQNLEDPFSQVLKDEGLPAKVDIYKLRLEIEDVFS
jgi:hypothetical protein